MPARYAASDLLELATSLFTRAGLDSAKATVVAEILLEGDLLGHTTHGLAFVAPYLSEIERGAMTKTGDPTVVADFPAAVTWDGRRLPGPWLTVRAIDLAMERAASQGTCTVVIRRSHHIGCLAAYLKRITDRGLVGLLTCSDPNNHSVAPQGGRRGVFTPNPLAAGWPTEGDPVILDVSMSIATNGLTNRLRAEGRRYPGRWAVDAQGEPTDDPNALFTEPPGALLPVGGLDHGHKGYALGLLIEALTGSLAGHGRADPAEGWTGTVFVQVLSPALFGGLDAFRREAEFVAEACRSTPPRPGTERVRLPGEAGLRRREAQLAEGVELYPGILDAIRPWAEKFGVPVPAPNR
ncbi:MAG TPA: Ldh family oxidoreductase [Opitutaceae bacterium]|nr:Ldh family oxidoreductase [Opitutaceae bacterium]